MKTLYLIRHAKSSWDYPELTDFERPLSKRGLRDAPFMGMLLREKQIKPDLFLSSPAKRAWTTAQLFASAMDFGADKIVAEPRIYEASRETLLSVIQALPDELQSVAVFCHNPAVTDLANHLTDKKVDNIPTSGVFSIAFDSPTWRSLGEGKGVFQFFLYPKKFLK
ncbi:MAG: histidine phosphatase family protein [Chloroherpetonaceae bacterium]|nr:histidine phosphatase family protein [Chloroherpetonaceae bacterium]MDW8438532.1 histidine phosphatase family protein [Chloroherpetonaceae bacterium]